MSIDHLKHAHDGSAAPSPSDSGDSGSPALPPGRSLAALAPKRAPNPNKNAAPSGALRAGVGAVDAMKRVPKLRDLTAEQAFELLHTARTADHVQLYLRDGRVVDGAILFNDSKGTGRIINVSKETSFDFRAEQIRDIKF